VFETYEISDWEHYHQQSRLVPATIIIISGFLENKSRNLALPVALPALMLYDEKNDVPGIIQ